MTRRLALRKFGATITDRPFGTPVLAEGTAKTLLFWPSRVGAVNDHAVPSSAVLVTGCSTGIGRATAARLARAGHRVYATARRLDSIEGLRSDGCELLELDVTDEASRAAAVAAPSQVSKSAVTAVAWHPAPSSLSAS